MAMLNNQRVSGWWFQKLCCPSHLPAGAAEPSNRGRACLRFAMVLELPAAFGDINIGSRINLVARLLCWDPCHDGHRFQALHDGTSFLAAGLLDGSGEKYTLLNGEFRRQYPVPVIGIDQQTVVFKHDPPSWTSLHATVELCAGFGGMTQGMATSGFHTMVSVDWNERFMKLYDCQGTAETVIGDVNELSTLIRMQKLAHGAGTLVAGFACQPFSRLGDQLGGLDARSMCLRGILASAYYLQVQAVILECVQPAANNSFVIDEVNRFLKASGFHLSQCELNLSDVWPCRRPRAWWLITSPFLGKVPLSPWPCMNQVTKVRHLLPSIQPWDVNDEDLLALKTIELETFGAFDETFHRFLLNFEGHAPCALHSWGSQLVGCECGCRIKGLSEHRLREKGLFGCLIKSCQTDLKNSVLRHLHPNEVMMLCAFDPMIDFGGNPRLTLAAAGQMASPLQAAWIFAALDARIQQLHGMPILFGSEARIQAYMAWVLMRGRQVWPADVETITDPKTVSLMRFWEEVGTKSLHEVMHPPNWPDLHPHDINIATILDHLICRKQNQLPRQLQLSVSQEDVAMTVLDEDATDLAPTPWFETPQSLFDVLPVGVPDECLVVFHHEFADPVKVKVHQGSTIQNLLDAHENLVGGVHALQAFDRTGNVLPFSHVLQLGQVICICCECTPPTSVDPIESVGEVDVVPDPTEAVLPFASPANAKTGSTVSPTAAWTHPVQNAADFPISHFGPCDAGECAVPMQRLPDCESWVSAAPLLGLVGDQFKNLHVPVVLNTEHLWSLKHQLLRAEDRVTILQHQEGVWSDDEFRFHISHLLQLRSERLLANKDMPVRQHYMLDPLLLTGWIHHGTHLCQSWGQSHPEIRAQSMVVLSACMIHGHWVPVVLDPQGDKLHFSTWDAPQNDHDALNGVIEAIGLALGFASVVGLRHHRLFFASEKCGALAMAFLHHSVLASMLPTCKEEVEVIHEGYRSSFANAVSSCQLARRPWIWGAGDSHDPPFNNEPGMSSSGPDQANPVPIDVPDACRSHQCITKEERLQLLRDKGKMWGDDEIRFHLMNMINHPNNVCNQPFSSIPGVFMLDPLMLTTWDSIGKTLCATWCQRHMTVPLRGFHVITVLLHNEHWFPVWFVPHGRTIVAHVIDDGITEPQVIRPMLDVFQEQFFVWGSRAAHLSQPTARAWFVWCCGDCFLGPCHCRRRSPIWSWCIGWSP